MLGVVNGVYYCQFDRGGRRSIMGFMIAIFLQVHSKCLLDLAQLPRVM